MSTFRAENEKFRAALLVRGFVPESPGRMSAPIGISHKAARALRAEAWEEVVAPYSMERAYARFKEGWAEHMYCENCGTMPQFTGFK